MTAAAAAGADTAVSVRPVHGRGELDRFMKLPWRIYERDRCWVPPLLSDVRSLLDPARRHPFHAHADMQLFLAWRAGAVVGRIAAIVNHRHNEFHEDTLGFFGLFEAIEDASVSGALLQAAEEWLRARGMTAVRGPFNVSTNDELASPGVQLTGHALPPSVLMTHTPVYYSTLLEQAGYTKARDLLSYWLAGPEPPPRLVRGVTRAQMKMGVVIRGLRMDRFDEEVRTVQSIYNSAWERNWGFVPMTEAEIEHMAKQLRPVVKPELCAIAEVNGEPVGFALELPDFNQALRHANGQLFPFGLLKLLWYRRRIDTARVLTLGLKPGFRHKGIDSMLILHLYREGTRLGYPEGECSWILEDNWDMRRGLERLGAYVTKTYRVYERPLYG